MKILVIGGTRFFGIPMVRQLVADRHSVTIATRGNACEPFGDTVSRIRFDRTDAESTRQAFAGKHFDIVIDKIAYCSNDVRRLLDVIDCERYVMMSSAAVYQPIRKDTPETDFDPEQHPLQWLERADTDYAEGKRQAEAAAMQYADQHETLLVRYPIVTGLHDYTGRLRFFADCIRNGTPFFADHPIARLSLIDEEDAGAFLAHAACSRLCGAVNGCSEGDVSVLEIMRYIEVHTGLKAGRVASGVPAPYNGYPAFATLDTARAKASGFTFLHIRECVHKVLDYYLL